MSQYPDGICRRNEHLSHYSPNAAHKKDISSYSKHEPLFSKITILADKYKPRSNFDWNYAVKILYTISSSTISSICCLLHGEEDEK